MRCSRSPCCLAINFFLALLLAILGGVVIGAAIELVLLRPMRGADIDTTMLVMIGAWIVMQNTEMLAWGGVAKAVVTPFPEVPLVIGPVSVSYLRIFVLAMALSLIAATYIMINKTKLGKAMRATFQDRDTAALMGVNINGIYTATFAIGSGLAAAAGALLGPVFLAVPTMGDLAALEILRHRDPRRARKHNRRGHRRLHSCLRGGARRRLPLLRISRCDRLSDHYPGAHVQADGPLLAGGARRMRRLFPILALAALASVPLWLDDAYLLHILITTGIFTIAAMSLNLLLGYTGQLSLGHVAFFGIGAYVSALTALGFDVDIGPWTIVHEPWPVLAGFVLAVAIAGLCGYLIGKLSFKVRGAYFVIVTISFAEVVRLVALNWVDLTQGPLALNNIPPFTLQFPGLGEYVLWGKVANYYLVLIVAVVAYVIIKRLVGSRIGRAMVALKENESLAVSVGINVTRYLVLAAVVSAALAGAAGSLYAHYVKIVDPEIFLFIYTVTMVIMVVTGGKGTLAGPVVGGLIFGILPVVLRSYLGPEFQWIFYGLFMIFIVFVLPQGIVPAFERRFARPGPEPPAEAVGARQ